MQGAFTARHLVIATCAFFGAIFAGTAAFLLVLDESFHAALYRSVVTISLTGIDTAPRGVGGEVVTILVILTGMAIYGYLASVLVEVIARGVVTGAWLERRKRKTIDQLTDHFIICGYGRVGRRVAGELGRQGERCIVVDFNPDAVAAAREAGELLIEGSGTEDENPAAVLEEGDVVIAVGTAEELRAVEAIFSRPQAVVG